ncbi:acyl-CoA dehydrogenase family protein [Nonomuraea sp. SBT364]|uniref:acyl-CoA dehydrogenase family protein n=1 Tax=Nonomuraea sp. SBT364 TaxID=1580530 RepID=UPI00069DD1FA|nr:hypothetical protein [Nonomuraea sp. SBT364]
MDLTTFVRGGLPDESHARLREAIPAGFFGYPRGMPPADRHALTYERFRHAGTAAPSAGRLLARPPELCALLERAAVADPALFHVMLLHYTLTLVPILRFGDRSTEPVRRRLEAMDRFGAVAMTEAGRSNSHLMPATVARFDAADRSFVLTTPDPAAVKFPTTAGHPGVPKLLTVYARLVDDGGERGVFLFLVPLGGGDGDSDGAAGGDGVHVLPAADNPALSLDWAAVRFDGLRLPFESWLAAGARITADGVFHDPLAGSRAALSMCAAPYVWRGIIAAGAAAYRAGAASLTLHSVDRPTQGRLAPGRPLIDHRNQQEAVLTALARGYALTAVANRVKTGAAWSAGGSASASTWTPWASVDLMLPLLKAAVTDLAEDTAGLCRTHSGAPGFLASGRLNGYRGLAHAYLSAGGDNQLILFDVARAMVERDRYEPPDPGQGVFDLSLEGCLDAARALELRLVDELSVRVTAPGSLGDWNPHLALAARTATALADRVILEILQDGPPRLRPVFRWFALDWAERRAGLLLDEAIAVPPLIGRIRALRDELCAELMPRTPELVEAFELPELHEPPVWSTSWTSPASQH